MAERRLECTWKRHVSEQLKLRDRLQRQAFEEIIQQCECGGAGPTRISLTDLIMHECLFQITVFWRSQISRLFCLSDTRQTNMSSRGDMSSGEATSAGVRFKCS